MTIEERALVILAIHSALAALAFAGDAFDWFAVSDSVKIFEDGYGCPGPKSAIDVFGLRGEYVSAQSVVAARKPLESVTVEIEGLLHEGGSASLPAAAIRWNFVGSVPVPQNTPYAIDSRLVRLAPARFPDYLSEERHVSLQPGQYQAVWFTAHVPKDALAGRYSGDVIVQTSRGAAALPFHLTVYPLRMPEKRHLKFVDAPWHMPQKNVITLRAKNAYGEKVFAHSFDSIP